mmetsp:Transcript_24131/g.36655  ORF Transcript_24131/g.36655 Transcript_24131/m.36655 type:complete len:82 (+) Transcript_24131:403-648(+)
MSQTQCPRIRLVKRLSRTQKTHYDAIPLSVGTNDEDVFVLLDVFVAVRVGAKLRILLGDLYVDVLCDVWIFGVGVCQYGIG